MLSFVFWNIAGKPLEDRVAMLAATHAADVVMLAECAVEPERVVAALSEHTGTGYRNEPGGADKVALFTRLPPLVLAGGFWHPLAGLTVRPLRVGIRPHPLLAIVHFPDKQSWDPQDQISGAGKLAEQIVVAETKLKSRRTVLVGDFNMNPFDPGMVSAHALHAVMTKALASREQRTVMGPDWPFFSNPMWGCFGDRTSGPPGTYYLRSSKPVNYFWNVYDQVLLRPALMDRLTRLEVLLHDGERSLLTPAGLPDRTAASDHLPIWFALDV